MLATAVQDKIYTLDAAHEPCLQVRPGEIFTLDIKNAFGKSFETVEEFEAFMSPENEEEKRRLNHPCTGPVEILTDAANISLAVEILDFTISKGYQCISKSTGLLKDRFSQRECMIYQVGPDWTMRFHDGDLCMRGSPKVGFMSTLDHEVRSCGRTCENGGNLDLNYLDRGSTIYLPVNYPKPLLVVGDLHICQGNGEAAGIAIEADGEVTLRVHVVDKIDFPVIDHKHNLIIAGWGETVDAALQKSLENTITYLQRVFPFCDWGPGEIYKFVSAEGNLVMGNSTGKIKTCGTVFFKKRLTNKFSFPVF